MKKRIKSILLVNIVLAMVLLFLGCKLVTVVPLNNESSSQFYYEDANFDPAKYAAEKWPEIVRSAKENAKPISDIMPQYVLDQNACGEKFGKRTTDQDLWNFVVTGSGKILKVNTESKNGLLELDIEPFDGQADCFIQIGPVVKGTAVRDCSPFINFKDFKNQLTFGDVGKAINKYSVENVSAKLPLDTLTGKIITFVGAFSQGEKVLIVPTEISVS